MSQKNELPAEVLPLFARLLEGTEAQAGGGGGTAPTYHCLDYPCTKKYPSDDDESTRYFDSRESW